MIESSTRLGLETGVSRLSAGTVLQNIVGLSIESIQIRSCFARVSLSSQVPVNRPARPRLILVLNLSERTYVRCGQFLGVWIPCNLTTNSQMSRNFSKEWIDRQNLNLMGWLPVKPFIAKVFGDGDLGIKIDPAEKNN